VTWRPPDRLRAAELAEHREVQDDDRDLNQPAARDRRIHPEDDRDVARGVGGDRDGTERTGRLHERCRVTGDKTAYERSAGRADRVDARDSHRDRCAVAQGEADEHARPVA
jgi:hypothetical protein